MVGSVDASERGMAASSVMSPGTPDPLIGRRVGGYSVASLIGEGGMGKVYLLVHVDSPELRRVVKVVHGSMELRYPQLVERFFREARAAASLRHPSIIEILDYSRFPEDGQPYLVMPFLDGADLGEHVDRVGAQQGHPGRISFDLALPLLLQVCAALRAAHARGIIHRDLKPSNCYVLAGGGERPRLILLDFGIAKVLDPALRQGDATRSRAVLGTPGYMAPEQARGHEVDHRADIYALGVLAYVLLTGRRPFKGATSEDLAIQQVITTPPALSALVPEIPGEVSELVMRCLAPVPAGRPGTVMEVARGLIRAAPNGRDVAREVAPDLLSAPVVRGPTEPTALATSLAGAAGRRATTTAESEQGRRVAWMTPAVVVTSAIAVAAVFLGVRLGSGRDASDAMAAQSKSAAPARGTSSPSVGSAQAMEPAQAPAAGAVAVGAVIAPADAGVAREAAPAAAPARAVPPARSPAPAPRPAASAPPRATLEKATGVRPAQLLRKERGELEIFVQPWAEIWLDGKHVGQTPFRQQQPAGRYRVRLVNEDSRRSETTVIDVTADQTTTIQRTW